MSIESDTHRYIAFFSNKNLESVMEMIDQSCTLRDPIIDEIVGAENIRNMLVNLFDSSDILVFKGDNIYVDIPNDCSIIEFSLTIGDKTFNGVDVIKWRDGKIKSLNAYFDTKSL